jgi:hypothetical protein
MCFPWDVANMVKIIKDLLPGAGSEWHAMFANGACGWYHNITQEEVPFNTPGEQAGPQRKHIMQAAPQREHVKDGVNQGCVRKGCSLHDRQPPSNSDASGDVNVHSTPGKAAARLPGSCCRSPAA